MLTIKIEWSGGVCPYQAEGVLTVKDVEYPFYFRFRGDRAQFYVWSPGTPWDTNYTYFQSPLWFTQQVDVTGIDANGYMEDAEAVGFIQRWAEEFARILDKD